MGAGESAYEEEEAEEVDEQTFLARATLFERLCDFYDEFNPEMFEAWGECSPAVRACWVVFSSLAALRWNALLLAHASARSLSFALAIHLPARSPTALSRDRRK